MQLAEEFVFFYMSYFSLCIFCWNRLNWLGHVITKLCSTQVKIWIKIGVFLSIILAEMFGTVIYLKFASSNNI